MNVAILPFDVGAIADAHDIELAGEAGGDAVDGVGGERPREPVQRGLLVAFARELA